MNFRQLSLAAGFTAMIGLSFPALAETMTGYAPTVKEMLRGHTVAPTVPLAQPSTIKPKVGMDPVYSTKKKTKKRSSKKKEIECPPGFVVQDKGCVQEEPVVQEQTQAQEALPVTTSPMDAPAIVEQPVTAPTPDCPATMMRDASGNCVALPAMPETMPAQDMNMVPTLAPDQGALPVMPEQGIVAVPQAPDTVPVELTPPAAIPTDAPLSMPVPCPEGQLWNASTNACAPM